MIRSGKFLLLLVAGISLVAVPTACRKKTANTNSANVKPAKVSLIPPGLDAPAYFNLGMDAQKHDRDDEATEAFEAAVKLQPEFPEGHLRLGLSYDVMGRTDDADKEYKVAVEQYRKKITSDGKDATDRFNLGLAYKQLKRYDEAAETFRLATKIKADYGEAFFELGLALIKTARYADAVNALKKAVELDPDNYSAQDALQKAQEGKDRIDSEVNQQKTAGKRNKNANVPDENNVNVGNNGGNTNNKPQPKATPKP
ncbi:MAG: tetratricopeptide repeat protein [Pyrinomonadaceae bacterium]